jgi:hypothetical protein
MRQTRSHAAHSKTSVGLIRRASSFVRDIVKDLAKAAIVFLLGAAVTTVVFYGTAPKGTGEAYEDRVHRLLNQKFNKNLAFDRYYFATMPISGESGSTLFWLGSIKDHDAAQWSERVIAIFEPGNPTLLDQIVGRKPEYKLVGMARIKLEDSGCPRCDQDREMFDDHQLLDVDGSGQEAFMVLLKSRFADRESFSFVLFRRMGNSWTATVPPDVKALLNPSLGNNEEPFLDEGEIWFGEKSLMLSEIANPGTYLFTHGFETQRREDIAMIVAILGEREGIQANHRMAVIVLKLTNSGYVLDRNWNLGKPFITAKAV